MAIAIGFEQTVIRARFFTTTVNQQICVWSGNPRKCFPQKHAQKKLIISLDKLITDKLIIAKAVAQKTESEKNKNRNKRKQNQKKTKTRTMIEE